MQNTESKAKVYIFDIDGTLAKHVDRGPFEEHKVHTDAPIEPVVRVLKALRQSGYHIVFVSGRTDGCEEATRNWLKVHTNEWNAELYMRKSGDQRKDSIIKKEIYEQHIFPKYEVLGVFDDRMQVCRMLYENEIFCFNVNQGLKEF